MACLIDIVRDHHEEMKLDAKSRIDQTLPELIFSTCAEAAFHDSDDLLNGHLALLDLDLLQLLHEPVRDIQKEEKELEEKIRKIRIELE
jgi:hypothetical protein